MLTRRQAEFVAELKFDDLPVEVVESVKARVLDTIGVMLAGSVLPDGAAVASVVECWGGPPEAGFIGLAGRAPTMGAALVNGTCAHALDFDDTHLPSIIHPSAVLVPTALAAGETASGRDVITALAAGYELCVRIGMAAYDDETRNSVFFEKGLHPTSVCGTPAAAAVAAKLLELDAVTTEAAIGVSASMSSGLLEANRTGGTVKRLHAGWAAHAGIAAAQLAAAGFTAPATVLEGRFGFFNALCDGRFTAETVVAGLGDRWETPGIFFKPYPTNHFTHAGIDGALDLRAGGLDPQSIERIELGLPTPVLRAIAEPREAKIRPESGYHAQFSGPFTVATALLGGGGLGVYLDDFTDDHVSDPVRLELAKRVACHADAHCDSIFPRAFPALLRVFTRDGAVRELRIDENRGSPARPLTASELALKFRLNGERALPAERVQELQELCSELEELKTLGPLTTTWEGASR